MSWQAVQWVFQVNRSVRGTALTVLAVIAEAAGPDGTNCALAIKTIAERARTTERNVSRIIAQLSSPEFGVLKVEFNAGRNGANRYAVLMDGAAEPTGQLLHFRRTPRHVVTPDNVSSLPDVSGDAPFRDDTLSPRHVVTLTTGAAGGDTLSAEPSLTEVDISPSVELGEGTASNEAEAQPPNKRGTRLPENWQPSPALIAWARKKGMPDEYQRWATEIFKDYFTAATGRGSTKSNWDSAWRVWLNRDFPKWQRDNRQHQPATRSAAEQWMNL